jgi:hypothetical protein
MKREIMVGLDIDDADDVRLWAAVTGESMSAVIRLAVREWLEARRGTVEEMRRDWEKLQGMAGAVEGDFGQD